MTGLAGGVDPRHRRRRRPGAARRPGVAVDRLPPLDVGAMLEAAGVIIDSEGFRVNAYLMQHLKQLSPHVRRNLERGARLGRGDRAAAERARAAVRDTLESLLADFPVLVLPTLAGDAAAAGRARVRADRADRARQSGRAARARRCRCPRRPT